MFMLTDGHLFVLVVISVMVECVCIDGWPRLCWWSYLLWSNVYAFMDGHILVLVVIYVMVECVCIDGWPSLCWWLFTFTDGNAGVT